jgi:pimeloyl-ACP methyl ester carboxylesterase
LCNGYVCTTQYWPDFVANMAVDHTVLEWDYRSHGQSEVPADLRTQNIPQYARDLALVMDGAGLDQAVLVGHSMGVQVMLSFADQFPGRVRGLVGLCGSYRSPFAALSDAAALTPVLDGLARAALRAERVFWPVMRRLLRSELAISVSFRVGANPARCPRERLDRLYEHVTQMNGAAVIEAFRGMIQYSAEASLGRLRCPTLLIAGGIDRAATPAVARDMQRRIAGAELEIYADCSHLAMIERAPEVHARVRRFLRERGLEPSEP